MGNVERTDHLWIKKFTNKIYLPVLTGWAGKNRVPVLTSLFIGSLVDTLQHLQMESWECTVLPGARAVYKTTSSFGVIFADIYIW